MLISIVGLMIVTRRGGRSDQRPHRRHERLASGDHQVEIEAKAAATRSAPWRAVEVFKQNAIEKERHAARA